MNYQFINGDARVVRPQSSFLPPLPPLRVPFLFLSLLLHAVTGRPPARDPIIRARDSNALLSFKTEYYGNFDIQTYSYSSLINHSFLNNIPVLIETLLPSCFVFQSGRNFIMDFLVFSRCSNFNGPFRMHRAFRFVVFTTVAAQLRLLKTEWMDIEWLIDQNMGAQYCPSGCGTLGNLC